MSHEDDELNKLNPVAEISAMQAVSEALSNLETAARIRVLRWAGELYGGIALTRPGGAGAAPSPAQSAAPSPARDTQDYGDAAELFSSAGPTTDMEKALVTAYWVQYHEGSLDFDTQTINRMLAHMGHKVTNITRAFEVLKRQKPALVVQTRKTGTTRQARKLFRVTTEGKKAVEAMLNR